MDIENVVINDLIEKSGYSQEQFLVISIMVFVVLALMVVVFRMLRIFRIASRRPRYQPNLRPLRRREVIYREEAREEGAEEGTGEGK